jgi:hypothetical protein
MSETRSPDELRAILAELESLGEEPGPDLLEELRRAELLEGVLQAHEAARPSEALPEGLELEEAAREAQAALSALHLLRASAGADRLTDARRDALWVGLEGSLAARRDEPARVLSFPAKNAERRVGGASWGWFAAAAAVLLAVGLAWGWSQREDEAAWDLGAQQAEARLERAEREHLQVLLSGSGAAPSGDHALRQLRFARQDSARTRLQARARRL